MTSPSFSSTGSPASMASSHLLRARPTCQWLHCRFLSSASSTTKPTRQGTMARGRDTRRTVCAQRSAVDLGSVGAAQVPELPARAGPPDLAVLLRHRRVPDVHPAGLGAPDREHRAQPRRTVYDLPLRRPAGHREAQQVRRPLLCSAVGLLPQRWVVGRKLRWALCVCVGGGGGAGSRGVVDVLSSCFPDLALCWQRAPWGGVLRSCPAPRQSDPSSLHICNLLRRDRYPRFKLQCTLNIAPTAETGVQTWSVGTQLKSRLSLSAVCCTWAHARSGPGSSK